MCTWYFEPSDNVQVPAPWRADCIWYSQLMKVPLGPYAHCHCPKLFSDIYRTKHAPKLRSVIAHNAHFRIALLMGGSYFLAQQIPGILIHT